MNSVDEARRFGVFLDLASQTGDVHVDGAGGGERSVAPDGVEKTIPTDRLAARFREEPEDGEFFGRQMKWLFIAPGLLLNKIQTHFTQHQSAQRTGGSLNSPEDGAHPR